MQNDPPNLEVNSPIYNAPTFRLLSLKEAIMRFPKKYRPLEKKLVQRLVVPGAYIKVLAESVGPTVTAEEAWLAVRAVSPKDWDAAHVGEVASMLGRSEYHGIQFRMLIHFRLRNVIDIQTSMRKL